MNRSDNKLENARRLEEDDLLRKLLENSASKVDLTDPIPIAFDAKQLRWLNAKEVMESFDG